MMAPEIRTDADADQGTDCWYHEVCSWPDAMSAVCRLVCKLAVECCTGTHVLG
jgi:hypothetical protein